MAEEGGHSGNSRQLILVAFLCVLGGGSGGVETGVQAHKPPELPPEWQGDLVLAPTGRGGKGWGGCRATLTLRNLLGGSQPQHRLVCSRLSHLGPSRGISAPASSCLAPSSPPGLPGQGCGGVGVVRWGVRGSAAFKYLIYSLCLEHTMSGLSQALSIDFSPLLYGLYFVHFFA